MATVTGLTAARMLDIEANSVVSGEIDGSGHLILTTHGGAEIDAGPVLGSIPPESLVHLLATNSIGETESIVVYPAGVSHMSVETGSGWSLNGGFGTVVTHNVEQEWRNYQWFHAHTNAETWVRNFYDTEGWEPWVKITNANDLAAAVAALETADDDLSVLIADNASDIATLQTDVANRVVKSASTGKILYGRQSNAETVYTVDQATSNNTVVQRDGSGLIVANNAPIRFQANFSSTEFGITNSLLNGRWLIHVAWRLHVSGGTFFEGARFRVNGSTGNDYDYETAAIDGGGDGVPANEDEFAVDRFRMGYCGGASLPGAMGQGHFTLQKTTTNVWVVSGTWMCNSGGALHAGICAGLIRNHNDINAIVISGVSGSTIDAGSISVVSPY